MKTPDALVVACCPKLNDNVEAGCAELVELWPKLNPVEAGVFVLAAGCPKLNVGVVDVGCVELLTV